MRPSQSTLKASTVHAYARQLIQETLELEAYQPCVPMWMVASVLVMAACWQTSLTGACALVRLNPDHIAVRRALYGCLPTRPRDLLQRLLLALRQSWPPHLHGGRFPMALDLHQIPYYGKKNTRGVTLRQKKASTKKSFTYATLCVLCPDGRYTVGLLPTRPTMRLTTLLEQLLGQADEADLSVSYLMLDAEFYSAEVFDWLQRKGIAFLVPAKKRGRKGTGNSYLFEPTCPVGWYRYRWTTDLRRWNFAVGKRRKKGTLTVEVQMAVARHQSTGEPVVFATGGLGKEWSPARLVQAYRKRFGIETKYRQLQQCLARTSSRKERLRLLLVGLALLLGNLWTYLHEELFSRGPVGQRERHLHTLRFTTLIAAVAADVAAAFGGYVSQWQTQRPLPEQLAAIQNV
jgi:putative transposase